MKILSKILLILIFIGCSTQSQNKNKRKAYGEESVNGRVANSKESNILGLSITTRWLQNDTLRVVSSIINDIKRSKKLSRYIYDDLQGKIPIVVIGNIFNETSNYYFPAQNIRDEFSSQASTIGKFNLIGLESRDLILDEIIYQHKGNVSLETRKMVGKQLGADAIILGKVMMSEFKSRESKYLIKQYSINFWMTDIQSGMEIFRFRKTYKKDFVLK